MKCLTCIVIIALVTSCAAPPPHPDDFTSWYKPALNPLMRADSTLVFYDSLKKEMVRWQKADVFNPAAVVKDGKVYLFTRSEDNPAAHLGGRTSRIGIAVSEDGLHFTQHPTPVLYPDGNLQEYDYPGGCEDPRVVETADGRYLMAYTSWNYKLPRLSIAVSNDLYHWKKTGPAFSAAYNGRFLNLASKSASMVTVMEHGRPVLAKLKGKYWMYWGEHFVNLAWSENLADWYPLLDDTGALKQTMRTRPGKFDSDLTECGPPALVTSKGIMLLYNGKNANDERADPALPRGTYSVGQVVFNSEDMETIVSRSDTCMLKPTLPHEITGQYKAGTTFGEGLVYFNKKWILYYGTADSFIGVAIAR